MMKKFLSVLCVSMFVFVMFGTHGNPVKAASNSASKAVNASTSECGCNVTHILGAERNKIVSDLLKSDEFKELKNELTKEGFSYHGANDIEVVKFNENGFIGAAVPFITEEGTVEMFVFINGVYTGHAPR